MNCPLLDPLFIKKKNSSFTSNNTCSDFIGKKKILLLMPKQNTELVCINIFFMLILAILIGNSAAESPSE